MFENTQISNLMKTRQVGAEIFHADKRTDKTNMMKPIIAFRNSVNAPKTDTDTTVLFVSITLPVSQRTYALITAVLSTDR